MKHRLTVILTLIMAALLLLSSCAEEKSIGTDDVLYGENGFLFAAQGDDYNYLADYRGELVCTDEQLQNLAVGLEKRAKALSNNGCQLYIVVIPNAQTVYSSYMPESIGEISANTRLAQIENYLNKNTDIKIINLAKEYETVKDEYQLYDNTSNTINAYGAYFACSAVLKTMQEQGIAEKNKLNEAILTEITETETEGHDLAIKVGSQIQNRTFSFENVSEDQIRYTMMGSSTTFFSTYVKLGFKKEIPSSPCVLIHYAKESDYEPLLHVFSSTFGGVGYLDNYDFSKNAINAVGPKVDIQFVYEDTMYTLLDDAINDTYKAGLNPGDDPYTTMPPQLIGNVSTDSNTVCLCGTVETGSVIHVSGDKIDDFDTTAQAGRFFISIKVPSGKSINVNLTAKVEGKDESDPVTVTCTSGGYLTVFAGMDSQLHYPDTLPDYYCTNLNKDSNMARTAEKLHKKLDKIRAASGKDTKYVYLIPPDCITAYPETATPEMVANKKSDYSRLMQIEDYYKDDDDIIIINLTQTILENKDKGKLYFQTDTHWNTLGAYFGYYKLMSVISEDFPAAAPLGLENYNVYQEWRSGGDLVSFLGVENDRATELKTICVPNFKCRSKITNYYTGDSSYVYSDQIKCVREEEGLPNAIMITDSFGANLFDFVKDAFGVFVRQTMWEYKTDTKLIAEIQPDYYIQVMVERNMGSFYVN